ncbi:hypothetical protein [Neobacillus niacini]|uniref:hypothetical protein n=1 Tax=Neobacillus niacini TaxID=86668 RepID=UPI0021CB6F8C|nr:hypothetical protein [Neobacillus niacini]MCM3764458.1 hypothetical protein [Neobacillus niacini]
MAKVKSVKFDGELIHVFNSAIYVFESGQDLTLQLDMIVSEIVVKKVQQVENVIAEIELEDSRMIDSIMHVKIIPGVLPQLSLFVELDDRQDYDFLDFVNENDAWFPNIEEGITIDAIRKVEMPEEEIRIKLKLPIDQVEWLKAQKKTRLNEILKEMIYEYWKKHNSK